jgi:hypothetical protein
LQFIPTFNVFYNLKFKNMKKLITSLAFCLVTFSYSFGQNNVTFSAADNWIGYMNVFNLAGFYEFGSGWAIADIKSTLNVTNNTLVLQPNFSTYANGPTDPYWVNQTTLEGNKTMEAITFVEPGSTFNNNDLTFSGNVVSNTIDSDYTVYFFIKALDPNNGYLDVLVGTKVAVLPASGAFSVSATAAELATGLVIQYGFYVLGVNANPANESTLGNVTISALNTNTKGLKDADNRISISPNPVMSQLSINTTSRVASYSIVNLSGQLMLSGENQNIIDVADLNPGMYILTTIVEGKKQVAKFIKE